MKADNALDKLVMLLSTDWFFECWPLVGIYVDDKRHRWLQRGTRDIANDFMSGATEYWFISFSRERVARTRQLLETLLRAADVSQIVADRIRTLTGETPKSTIDDRTAWLLLSITEMLFEDELPDEYKRLDPAIRRVVVEGWSNQTRVTMNLEERLCSSNTSWDRYIVSLTPDLPTYLADYASLHIARKSQFDSMRSFLSMALTSEQQAELMTWYSSVAQSLAGEPVVLPSLLS